MHATVVVPGSKSLTNRTLVLSALGSGPSTISGALRSRDTDLMIGALQTLGLRIDGDGSELAVAGGIAPAPNARVDCGLAGTVLRFVPPLAALAGPGGGCTVEFDGDEQARARPIAPLLDALRTLGVDIVGDAMPFRVRGTGTVKGGTVAIDASASSQFVSGLLLSGAAFDDGVTVEHTGTSVPSAPHIAMTVAMLRQAGVEVDDATPNRWRVAPGPVAARHWIVEPDLSSAFPFLAAAVVTGGTVRMPGLPSPSLQPVDTVVELLGLMNATVAQTDSHLEVSGDQAGYSGLDVDLHEVGELTPAVAALAALAAPGSVSTLRGVAHLRGHETDRLAALCTEINGLGGDCRETADGLTITAAPLHSGTWHAYADHRMAMAGAIVGLTVPGIEIDDIATTSKTLPEFPQLWTGMLAGE